MYSEALNTAILLNHGLVYLANVSEGPLVHNAVS